MIEQNSIRDLHQAYVRISGMTIRLDVTRERAWFEFLHADFTMENLLLVMKYLRKEISAGKRNLGALKFSNLVQQLDRFEEDLGMAQHASRGREATRDFTRTLRTGEQSAHTVIDQEEPAAVDAPKRLDRNIAAGALRSLAAGIEKGRRND